MARAQYSVPEFARLWNEGVEAEHIAARYGVAVNWVYHERKRLQLKPRRNRGQDAGRAATLEGAERDRIIDLIVAAVQDAADRAMPCPTNEVLAGLAGTNLSVASGVFQDAVARGKLHILAVLRGGRRLVEVAASGARTAGVDVKGGAAPVHSLFRTCQWIDGQIVKGGDTPKCGIATVPGRPYCAQHCARCYAPPLPSRLLARADARAV